MENEKSYLVPDYYPSFKCKMGDCRHACCVGWPITISMSDYFRLLSVDCSHELRDRIDTAMHPHPHPSEDTFAQICPRYDGQCKMRMDDGRCHIQAELGEDALADVCRLYPRGPRNDKTPECSCTNSCEGVVEAFMVKKEPITFINRYYDFHIKEMPPRQVYFDTFDHEQEIRLFFIKIVQNRAFSFRERIIHLGIALEEIQKLLEEKNEAKLVEYIRSEHDYNSGFAELRAEIENKKDRRESVSDGIIQMFGIMEKINSKSVSIRDFGEEATEYFKATDDIYSRYEEGEKSFEQKFPDYEILFEHLLVNHMFFERFPFQDRPLSLLEEFSAICAVYAILKILCIGCLAGVSEEEKNIKFTDICSSAFRLISHTSFDLYAVKLLYSIDCMSEKKLAELIRL